MNATIEQDLDAIAAALVSMELVRVRPAEPCRVCTNETKCYWHKEPSCASPS